MISTNTAVRRGVMRLVVLLIVLTGASFAVVTTTDTAQAAGCFPIRNLRGEIVGWDCPPHRELVFSPDPPCRCPFEVDWRLDEPVSPETLVGVHDHLEIGIGLLDAATATPQPEPALEQAALDELTIVAAKLGGTRLDVFDVYDVDADGNILPLPQPLYPVMWAFGSEMAGGIGLLQDALASPDKAPGYRDGALAAFERGIDQARQVI